MPRIEYIPDDFDFDSGDGSPTVDLCKSCACGLQEGDPINDAVADIHGVIGSVDVEHPPFDECDYECEVCGKHLTEKDD